MTDSSPLVKFEEQFTHSPAKAPGGPLAVRPPRFFKSQTFQRIVFYVGGGGVGLAALLFIAKSMNPPDSALRGGDLIPRIGHWDGTWVGSEVSYTLSGHKLAEYNSTFQIWSKSSDVQTVTLVRRDEAGAETSQSWVNTVTGNGDLLSRSSDEGADAAPYAGSIDGGQLSWYRKTPGGLHTRRSWVRGATLHAQEIIVPAEGTGEAIVITGTFAKTHD